MGFVTSAETLYAKAYLTDKGREYLFNKSNIRFDEFGDDLFAIQTFGLGDPDVNYRTTSILETGEVPDISGKNEGCLKTSVNYEQRNLLFYQNFDQIVSEDVEYNTNLPDNILNISINLGNNDLPVGPDSPIGGGPDDGAGVGNGGINIGTTISAGGLPANIAGNSTSGRGGFTQVGNSNTGRG